MIRLLEDNDAVEAINLMDKSTKANDYYHGYDRNETIWISYFLSLIDRQSEHDPKVLVIGDFDDITGKMNGFLSAETFVTYYTNEFVMDVKDCIVDPDNVGKNGFIVARLFDVMINVTKERGGKHWRADSVHPEKEAMTYAKFLQKRYDCAIHTSVRGVID